MKLRKFLNEASYKGIKKPEGRYYYYTFADGVSSLGDLLDAIPSKDAKLESLVKKAHQVNKEIYNHLEKKYKGWD